MISHRVCMEAMHTIPVLDQLKLILLQLRENWKNGFSCANKNNNKTLQPCFAFLRLEKYEAMSKFFAKNGSKDPRIAMFAYHGNTVWFAWCLIHALANLSTRNSQNSNRKQLSEWIQSPLGFPTMGIADNLGIATVTLLTDLCHYIIATLGITTFNFDTYVAK